ncbi:MAG: fibro-slime domain-containing protein [Phycisphaerae bacterium]
MRTKTMSVVAAVVLAGGFGVDRAAADQITLTSIIRDFQSSHPDFETTITDDRGFVSATIGGDRKPVYIGDGAGGATATTSGAANFNQWYNDTPGVNQSTTHNLVLNNGMVGPGGVYSFSDTSFFPIDGQMFGNEGNAHNYHFTLELHSKFTFAPGLFFNMSADDDLFVFINDQLVIDLGGVHPPETANVNLDTLGLVNGQTYDFDLFFAERHTTLSNLSFDTSIQFVPEPGTLGLLALGAVSLLRRRRFF